MISLASYKLTPDVPAFLEDSEPARSIIVKYDSEISFVSSFWAETLIVKMTWLHEDSSFKFVEAVILFAFAWQMIYSNCSKVSKSHSFVFDFDFELMTW